MIEPEMATAPDLYSGGGRHGGAWFLATPTTIGGLEMGPSDRKSPFLLQFWALDHWIQIPTQKFTQQTPPTLTYTNILCSTASRWRYNI